MPLILNMMKGKNENYFHEPTKYDEGLFTDALKDLRNVKQQLYSAAEHFEDSYYKNDGKQMLLESLKDYISKSLIKTIDHLGCISYKLDNFLHHNLNQLSSINLQVVCIEQRLQTCEAYANNVGLSQQSVITETPKYRTKYIVPVIATECRETKSSGVRKWYGEEASSEFPRGSVDFLFTKASLKKRLEKRSRSMSPLHFRSPNIWRKKDMEVVYPKKTTNLFKLLLTMYKSKNNNAY
ncbi:hypothetical protein LXL04_029498 [Taraxacum kok-saghyz]